MISNKDKTIPPPGYAVKGRFWTPPRGIHRMVPGIGDRPYNERHAAGLAAAWEHYEKTKKK